MKKKEFRPYQQCKRCVMDTSALEILFDQDGNCNFCNEFIRKSSHVIYEDTLSKNQRLTKLVAEVKHAGIGKKYDCIVGVSGGVDSSWTLVEVKRLGLRPLAVHMDNGWNSELAQNNISNLVNTLKVDLHTYVIDWIEYRKLMQSFFEADVVDVELLYDNAMLSVNYKMAIKYNVKYILAGTNQVTEGMRMPDGWNWFKYDKKNILSIAKRHGIKKIVSFPFFSTWDFVRFRFFNKIDWVSFLDYVDYNKSQVLNQLELNYAYKRYPYKHYESVFTRFYQGYILPNKFGIDKRKIHLSTLIISNQVSREEAQLIIKDIPYPSEADLNIDIKYFLKKMMWKIDDLENYISRDEKSHLSYSSEKYLMELLLSLKKKLKF